MIRHLDEQREVWAWLGQRPPWLLQVAFDLIWFWRVLFPRRTRRPHIGE